MGTTAVTAVVDEDLSREATAVLAEIGMSVDEAFKLLLTQVVHDHCLPFSMHLPNAETIAAFRETEAGETKQYSSVEELFKEMRS